MFVAMHVSADSGVTWNFPCDSLSGDVGAAILTGTGKHIIWDFGKEHPQTSGTKFMVQIVADDAGFESGTVTDIDGNLYQTVKIGDQWWMAENLKVTHYRNGDVIPNVTDGSEFDLCVLFEITELRIVSSLTAFTELYGYKYVR